MTAPQDAFEAGILIARTFAARGISYALGGVRAQIVIMLGEDEPRVATWDRIWRDHRPG